MLGISDPMNRVRQRINRVAKTDATVLIYGETGTGKEVAADEIYRSSYRADQPFIKVNCSAIPESLWESELFGYEKGSFTGALKNGKAGLMESANHGTLLLDEIGEMPLSMQPKLLRAIQERSVLRVGGVNPIPVDLRIIATTNRDLAQEVEAGRFREDLYYRLNVIPIEMPPLRQRGEDVRLMAQHYLDQFRQKYRRTLDLTPEAWKALEEYDWPGNVRQLRNHMERLVVLCEEDMVTADQLRESLGLSPREEPAGGQVVNLQEATEELHARLIRSALMEYHTTYRAAEALGISQPTLVRKAKALGIASGEERSGGESEIKVL
jgi:transcriptional regulator with PAS, ATPase and Fis domain